LKREKIDLSEERRILSYMITSTSFLTKVHSIAIPKLFKSSFSRIVSEWIWEYYDYTSQAPKRGIEEIYLKKNQKLNEDDKELIKEFLSNLSKDWEKYEPNNVIYTAKNATEYFGLRSLEKLRDRLTDTIESQDKASGERLISEYRKVERPSSKHIDLLTNASAIKNAFSHEHEHLFSFPGALGSFVGTFMRGDFFAIMGAMKRGKSHYLWYTGNRALNMGLKVLFISLEMTEKQMLRRMWQGMTGQPYETGKIRIPAFKRKGDKYEVGFNHVNKSGMDLSKVEEKQEFYRKMVRTGELKFIEFPTYGASARDIETELINLEYYEGFIPDVVIVDYADILKPINERVDYRHQLDTTWKKLRGIAQDRSLLMVTGSQTGRGGMERDVTATDVAEDYRKLAHVTKMIALNQNKKEKEDGIMRMSNIVQREGKMNINEAIVLQCYDIGRPYIDSMNREEVDIDKYHEKEKKK
jgi:replicative DNA helicase